MTRASIKKAHQLLAPTAALADMVAVAPMKQVLVDVGANLAEKKRKQAKTKARAARARRSA